MIPVSVIIGGIWTIGVCLICASIIWATLYSLIHWMVLTVAPKKSGIKRDINLERTEPEDGYRRG